MTRVRHVGRWKGRFYRAVAAVGSAAMLVNIWRRMPWHDRMLLLADWEELSPRERLEFGPVAGRHLKRAMFGYRMGIDTEELEALGSTAPGGPDAEK